MEKFQDILSENSSFSCEFCDSTFTLKKNLVQHIKTNKKCISRRPKITITCIWCNQSFITKEEREKHYKKCTEDKEQIHIITLERMNDKDKQIIKLTEEKNKIIEDKDKQIKDLQDKLFKLANKPTTTNNVNTLNNVKLVCGKPLDFSVKSLLAKMRKTLTMQHILLGRKGLVKWLLESGCTNPEGKVSIQTTDKNRISMRYVHVDGNPRQISGTSFKVTIGKVFRLYKKTKEYKEIKEQIEKDCAREESLSRIIDHDEFFNVENGFIRKIVSETYVGHPSNCITEYDEDIEDMEYTDDDIEEDDNLKIEEVLSEREKRLQEAYERRPKKFIIKESDIFYDETPYNSD